MFGDFDAAITDVEDLAADDSLGLDVMARSAAIRTDFGSMDDDLMRLRDLPERASRMAGLSANFQIGLLSERTSALRFLPRRIERRRRG